MHRISRYAVALVVGAVVTGGVAVATPNPLRELLLLLAIAQVYVVGTAVALGYPEAIWGADGNWVSAAFTGVLTFAGLGLLLGVEGGQNLAVAVLGWGLAAFGFVAGTAFERERDPSDGAADGAVDAGADADADPKVSAEERDPASSD